MDYDSYMEYLKDMRDQANADQETGVNDAMQEIAELTNRLDETEPYLKLQLAVMLEDRFDHRTTLAAIDRLLDDGILHGREVPSIDRPVTFVYPAGTSPTERIQEIAETVWKMRAPEVRKGCQEHARSILRLALAGQGFDVKSGDRVADMIISRDGARYGVVVHNRMEQLEVGAMELKAAVCRKEKLTPVFFSRITARRGCAAVLDGGGFCGQFSDYLMPFLFNDLAENIRYTLMLPVEVTEHAPSLAVKHFVKWHFMRLSR